MSNSANADAILNGESNTLLWGEMSVEFSRVENRWKEKEDRFGGVRLSDWVVSVLMHSDASRLIFSFVEVRWRFSMVVRHDFMLLLASAELKMSSSSSSSSSSPSPMMLLLLLLLLWKVYFKSVGSVVGVLAVEAEVESLEEM